MRAALVVVLAAVLASAAWAASSTSAPHVPGAPRCPVFPASNVWNKRIDRLPVAGDSARLISTVGAATGLHPDFGTIYGIPYAVVGHRTPHSHVSFDYADESDR